MGNCAAGCHFRPYSFASSPFDDFAEMKNSTRKIVCQHLSAPPLDGPPTTAEIAFRKGSKGKRRSLLATRGAAASLAGATALRPSFPHMPSPSNPPSTWNAVSRVHDFPSLPRLCSLIGHKLIYPIRLVLGRRSAMCGRCAQASRSRLSRTRSHE